MAWRSMGLPPIFRYCFGPLAAMRAPTPAAGIKAK